MICDKTLTDQSDKSLHQATRPFAEESAIKSWWYAASTLGLLAVVLGGAGVIPWWPARISLSILGGLLVVRAFVLYHDFMHGAILRNSRIGKFVIYIYGLILLTPPRAWRHSHNFHHANVGKPIPIKEGDISLLTSDIGAFPLMTTDMWRRASFWQRLRYRVARHPLSILFGYLTAFFYRLCLSPPLSNPRRYWDAAVSLLVHGGLIGSLWFFSGFQVALFAFVLPFAIASALGAFLFFAQHNFRGMRILPVEDWSHIRAALESSSYLKLAPIMNWITANIGYHHVHHLNSRIPFYRLPEAMAAIPDLQHAIVSTLRPRDVIDCLRLSLWDTKSQRLVTYSEADAA